MNSRMNSHKLIFHMCNAHMECSKEMLLTDTTSKYRSLLQSRCIHNSPGRENKIKLFTNKLSQTDKRLALDHSVRIRFLF